MNNIFIIILVTMTDSDNNFPRNNIRSLERELRTFKKRIHTPKVDLLEFKESYMIKMEIPGVLKEDLKIELKENHFVLVSGIKRNTDHPDAKEIYRECKYDEFTRRVKLPGFVKLDIVNGTFVNGVLCLRFSKLDLIEHSNTKEITF